MRSTLASDNPIRVLILDDLPDMAMTTGMLLELRGYAVALISDSTQCQSQIESFDPDVLLLDIAMPEISGYDLAKEIRSNAKFDRLAIIAVSGYGDGPHVQQSIDFGCDRHLVKPVDCSELEAAIVEQVERHRLKSVFGGKDETNASHRID